MRTRLQLAGKAFDADLGRPLDISIPIVEGTDAVNCFYAPPVEFIPVREGGFVGSTRLGGPLNFMNVRINPHGNGTHTECVGHISGEPYTIHRTLRQFHFPLCLVSVYPRRTATGDRVIFREQVTEALDGMPATPALAIRTLPNDELKLRRQYSGTNPPYLDSEAARWMVDAGIEHLLIDLPSVDREEDEGKLLAHHAFWQYPEAVRTKATITELIFVNNSIPDGLYLLNLQINSFELDVSPSKPVLYALHSPT